MVVAELEAANMIELEQKTNSEKKSHRLSSFFKSVYVSDRASPNGQTWC